MKNVLRYVFGIKSKSILDILSIDDLTIDISIESDVFWNHWKDQVYIYEFLHYWQGYY